MTLPPTGVSVKHPVGRGLTSRLLQNYCGGGLLRCRSLESSTYFDVRLAFSLAYALHPALLMTFSNTLRRSGYFALCDEGLLEETDQCGRQFIDLFDDG